MSKITHEQARKFLNASYQAIVQKYGSGIQKSNAIMEEDFWTAYINQQEKQEKLLTLYKGAFDKANNEILKYFIDEQDKETAFSNVIGALDDRETIKQIREL